MLKSGLSEIIIQQYIQLYNKKQYKLKYFIIILHFKYNFYVFPLTIVRLYVILYFNITIILNTFRSLFISLSFSWRGEAIEHKYMVSNDTIHIYQ